MAAAAPPMNDSEMIKKRDCAHIARDQKWLEKCYEILDAGSSPSDPIQTGWVISWPVVKLEGRWVCKIMPHDALLKFTTITLAEPAEVTLVGNVGVWWKKRLERGVHMVPATLRLVPGVKQILESTAPCYVESHESQWKCVVAMPKATPIIQTSQQRLPLKGGHLQQPRQALDLFTQILLTQTDPSPTLSEGNCAMASSLGGRPACGKRRGGLRPSYAAKFRTGLLVDY